MPSRTAPAEPDPSALPHYHRQRALVVGVDDSKNSWRALHYAFGQARQHRATVIAVHAIRRPFPSDTCYIEQQEAVRAQADQLSSALAASAVDGGIALELVCQSGRPADLLIQVAAARRADVLIVGASRWPRFRWLGSTAARAVRRSPVPVTVVR